MKKEHMNEQDKVTVEEDQKKENLSEKAADETESVNTPDDSASEQEKAQEQSENERLQEEVAQLKERLMRKAADFENYKRRTEIEQSNLLKYGGESIIIKLLPVIDDFERSLEHIDGAKDVESIKRGIHLIYEKLLKTLKENGIEKIDAEGKPFDVDYHEAVMQQPAPNVEPFTVINEVENGYMFRDKVIRHSKVIVSSDSE